MGSVDPDRRRLLAYAGTGVTVAVTGCLGGSEGATPSTSTATDTATDAPPTETDTATRTERPTEQQTPEPAMSTVFHFSDPRSEQNHAVANVSNLLADDSVDLGDVALVANGRGLKLLVEGDSTVADEVRGLVDDGVQFYACHNSMEALGVAESDLLDPAIEVVPAGVGTLTELQAKEDYAYIKTP